MNEMGRRFVGRLTPQMFANPPRKRDVFLQAFKDVWAECESSRAMGIPTPVVFLYLTDMAQSKSSLQLNSIQKIGEVEFHVMLLGAFLRCARYYPTDRLAYPRTVFGCSGGGALSHVLLGSVRL